MTGVTMPEKRKVTHTDLYLTTEGGDIVDPNAHGSRHNRGDADPIDYSLVSRLADSGDVSCSVGTGGSASRTTVYSLPANWYNFLPLVAEIVVGGTVGTGETVDVSVKVVLDDGTEIEVATYSVSGSTGSTIVGPDTLLTNLYKGAGTSLNDKRITSVVADVKTSATSTSATVTVRVIGLKT